MRVIEVNPQFRTLNQLIEIACRNVVNKKRVEKVVKRTGNKKSLHQKSKNRVKTWIS